ncbi:MAG: hypothetical protein EB039_13215, partial [Proteobacteria bacterium]|nr:hypothetical protein [Pseudomonadota bacterium]
AREVYDRVRAIKGDRQVALITGEERIEPPEARYFLCTAEAMPRTTRKSTSAVTGYPATTKAAGRAPATSQLPRATMAVPYTRRAPLPARAHRAPCSWRPFERNVFRARRMPS